MLLLSICKAKKLNYVLVLVVLAFSIIGCVKTTETNEPSKSLLLQADQETPVVVLEQKSVKKELKVNLTDKAIAEITLPQEKDDHTEQLVIIDKESVTETSGRALEQQIVTKNSDKVEEAKPILSSGKHQQYHEDEDFVLSDKNDISGSLKTGFYFFLILSSAAVVFIIFKIYRLRLSRAERKYGVQGDRSMQELTPLPLSLEDGHSDEEDQTLFEIQRQNIRIL